MVENKSKSLRAKNLLATLLQLLLCTRIWMPFLTLLSCPPIDLFVKLVYCCFSTTIFPNCFLWTSLIQLETLSRIDRMCQIANDGQQQYLVKFCHRKNIIFSNSYIFYYIDTSIKNLYRYGDRYDITMFDRYGYFVNYQVY